VVRVGRTVNHTWNLNEEENTGRFGVEFTTVHFSSGCIDITQLFRKSLFR
jgi:hypothetical protein